MEVDELQVHRRPSCRSHAGRVARTGGDAERRICAALVRLHSKRHDHLLCHGDFHGQPRLTLGSGKATTLTLHAMLHGCTGSSAAAKVTGGTLSGKSVDTSASCVAFENSFPPLTGKVTYKTTSGSFAPTALAFNGGTLGIMTTPLAITYPKSGGSGTAKGSFATKSPKMVLDMPVPYSQWVASCQSSAGLSTMTITSDSTVTA